MNKDQILSFFALEGLAPELLAGLEKLITEEFVYHKYDSGNDYAINADQYVEATMEDGIVPREEIDLESFHEERYAIPWVEVSLPRLRILLRELEYDYEP